MRDCRMSYHGGTLITQLSFIHNLVIMVFYSVVHYGF